MIDARDFRNALGHFATGVTVVTTRAPDNTRVGVTVNSFAALSLDPPLVLWSLARKSWSLAAFETAGHFAVHVLCAAQRDLSDRFARTGSDKFAGLESAEGTGGVPLLFGCAAVFECSKKHCYDGGDHLILVGRVENFVTTDKAPLLFYRGCYATPENEVLKFTGLMKSLEAA